MATESVSELLSACKNLAIDIRKVRDVVQGGTAPSSEEVQALVQQIGAHVAAVMDASKDADASVAEAALSSKTLAVALLQLLTRVAREGAHTLDEVRAKLTTLNMAFAGKIKTLHEIVRDAPNGNALNSSKAPASTVAASGNALSSSTSGLSSSTPSSPSAPSKDFTSSPLPSASSFSSSTLTSSSSLASPSGTRSHQRATSPPPLRPMSEVSTPSPQLILSVPSTPLRALQVDGASPSTPLSPASTSAPASASASVPIDLEAAHELVKAVKDDIYGLLDEYKAQRSAEALDSAMDALVERCKALVELGAHLDPEARAMIKMPLKKIDKCIAKPGLESGLQAVMKELHRVVRDVLQRYRDLSSGRSPLSSLSSSTSSSTSTATTSSTSSSSTVADSSLPTTPLGFKSGSKPMLDSPYAIRGRRANTTASGGAMLEALGEVNKLVGENTKRDPTELLTLDKELGKGASGSVWRATSKNGQVFAIKMVSLSSKTMQSVIKEIKTMQEIKHPNTLEYFTCYKKETDIWIVMEYCDAGSVLDHLVKRSGDDEEEGAAEGLGLVGLPEAVIGAITRQTLAGLKYIHSLQKIHRDIKAGNLLLTTRAEVKIADFGTAAEADVRRTTVIGSSFWMAPETLDQRGYDYKADIWSLGITIIEMAEKNPPYFDMQPHQVAQAILHNTAPTLKNPQKYSPDFLEFLRFCLQKDTRKRFSAATLETHQWILKASSSALFNFLNPTAPKPTPRDSSAKLTDAEVDKITSNIILPPINVDLLIGIEGSSHRQHLSSGALLDAEVPKSKKSHSDKRPSRPETGGRNSRALLTEEMESQLTESTPMGSVPDQPAPAHERSPDSSPTSPHDTAHRSAPTKLIIKPGKSKLPAKPTPTAPKGESVDVFLEGNEEPIRVTIESSLSTSELLTEIVTKHFPNKGLEERMDDLCIMYVNSAGESLLTEDDIPSRIVAAHRKSKIDIHFILR